MSKEVHLFILWEKALDKRDKILADITEHFTIVKQIEIEWTPALAASNFTRFCGTRLGNNLSFKIDNCGTGKFLVVVVRDEAPIYEMRHTFHGDASVNVKMFEAKQCYRDWTGGGIRVHATDNITETNHDLTLLTGKNVADFLKTVITPDKETIKKDLEGTTGWKSIEHLFYVLNNTVRYAIMRGYGELSSGNYIDHGDTDIMTDDYENLWLIVNAPKYNKNIKPKAKVTIGDETYLLDIWNCGFSGLNYFDPVWSKRMLDTAIIQSNGLKTLDPANDFYCLLYHCLTNKGYIADDYLPKLLRYKSEFGIIESDWNKILIDFLKQHNYEVIRPIDTDNPFNLTNPYIEEYALQNGGICVFSDSQIKIYENENTLTIKCLSDRNHIDKNNLVRALTPKQLQMQTSQTTIIKTIYRRIIPKRVQRFISKVRKHLK